MAITYDTPTTGEDLNTALQGGGLDQATINALLDAAGVDRTGTTNDVVVARVTINADGTTTVEAPEGQTPQFVVVDATNAPENTTYNPPDGFEIIPSVVFDTESNVTWNISTNAAPTAGQELGNESAFSNTADGAFDRVIASGSGNDNISVTSGEDVSLDGRQGNDILTTGSGNDSINGGEGNDIITAGAGNDTITGGAGNDSIFGSAGEDSIDAGTGYDYMNLDVNRGDLQVTNGELVSSSTGSIIKNVQYLEFADGSTATVSTDAIVAATMRLYDTVLGRSAELGGAEWWSDNADSYVDVMSLAATFLASDEFNLQHPAGLSDSDFVNLMYENTFDRDPDEGGNDFWINQLQSGLISRAHVATLFADSDEARADQTNVIQIDDDDWV
ncbi:Cyclolysin [Thiorhodovibrio winogradskyi]|uniref:Cyclolysin n=1 Tax=Thiorhodovibrio winogradskyi TaxID=77007 RepID=A0ABZ0SCC7_9GAMM|nr:DUF4214 domain-containing protein [Thiorhodovibrio winogradskyi]